MDEEKLASAVTQSLRFEDTGQGHHHHDHHFHTPRRIKQFLHPDGKKRQVASSPEEAEILKRTTTDDGEEVLVLIHGTQDHVMRPSSSSCISDN